MAKQRVLEVIDLWAADGEHALLMPKLRYALKLACGHVVLRRTNVCCCNNQFSPGGKGGGRCALCEICRASSRRP